MRILLDEKDFEDLVSGKITKKDIEGQSVEIALQDIGYLNMLNIIDKKLEKL